MIYFLSLLLIVISGYPLYKWVKLKDKHSIPTFEFHSVFYAVTFGIGGFLNEDRLLDFGLSVNDEQRVYALITAIIGLISLYSGYYIIGNKFFKFSKPIIFHYKFSNQLIKIIIILYLPISYVSNILDSGNISGEFIVSFLIQPLKAIKLFLLIYLIVVYYKKEISGIWRSLLIYIIFPCEILIFSGALNGQVAGIIQIGLEFGIVMSIFGKKIPLYLVFIVLFIFFLYQPIKSLYRTQIWVDEDHAISTIERFSVIANTFTDYYFSDTTLLVTDEITSSALNRLDHLSTTAAIISTTPFPNPYLYGASYLPLLTKLIPRFIWNDKPGETFGNTWAKNYGYLSDLDDATSYNLPWLPEMYMNFGIYGVVFVSLIIGISLKWLFNKLWHKPLGSIKFSLGLTMAMQLIIIESNLSLMVGTFLIWYVSIYLILYSLNKFSKNLIINRKY